MANRILLDKSGLRVSKPGVNVLTAEQRDLIFDSSWSQITPYMKGTVPLSTGSSGVTVLFGKTFTNRPLCILRPTSTNYQYINDWFLLGGDGGGNWMMTQRARLLSDRLIIYRHAGGEPSVNYIIWDFDL